MGCWVYKQALGHEQRRLSFNRSKGERIDKAMSCKFFSIEYSWGENCTFFAEEVGRYLLGKILGK